MTTVVLPEIISERAPGAFVRQGDDAWLNIVRWSLSAMIEAEEYESDHGPTWTSSSESENPNVAASWARDAGAGAKPGPG